METAKNRVHSGARSASGNVLSGIIALLSVAISRNEIRVCVAGKLVSRIMTNDPMQLSISGNSYTITSATLIAYVIDPARPSPSVNGFLRSGLFWNIDVEVRNEWISFWIYGLQLQNIRRWEDVVGRGISCHAPRNEIIGEMDKGWYGGNWISGHLEILEDELRFTQREGCRLRLPWQGICSAAPLGCEPDIDERLKFTIDCWCVFEGIGSDNRKLISRFLDLDDFVEEALDIDNSSSHSAATSVFKPYC